MPSVPCRAKRKMAPSVNFWQGLCTSALPAEHLLGKSLITLVFGNSIWYSYIDLKENSSHEAKGLVFTSGYHVKYLISLPIQYLLLQDKVAKFWWNCLIKNDKIFLSCCLSTAIWKCSRLLSFVNLKSKKSTLCCSAFNMDEYKIKPAITKSINKLRFVVDWVLTWCEVRHNAWVEERNEKTKTNIAKQSRQSPGTQASTLTREKKYRN